MFESKITTIVDEYSLAAGVGSNAKQMEAFNKEPEMVVTINNALSQKGFEPENCGSKMKVE